MKYADKDQLELLQECEDYGYCNHICPNCGEEMNNSEADADNAYCENCQEIKNVEPAI